MTDMTDAQHLTDPDAPLSADLSADPAAPDAETEAQDALLASAIASHQAWDFDAAEAAYRELLALKPAHADANHNLGVLLAIQRNQPASALPYFEAALNADSHSGQHWFSYIDALIRADQHAVAAQFLPLAQAHGLQPSMANVLADRLAGGDAPAPVAETPASAPPAVLTAADKEGLVALFRAGQFEEGEARTKSLIAAHPDDGFLWKALGTMLQPQGRKEEALAAKVRAAELLPHDVEALCNLGRAYFELSRPAEAERALRSAIALAPGHAEAHNNLGLALNAQGQVSEAHRSFQRAVQVKPDFAEAHNNLSGIYTAQGLIDEAVHALRQAVAAKPDYRVAFDNLLFVLNYHPTLSAEEIFEAYAAYDRQFGVPQRQHWQPHTNDRRADRRLRVGYVSPDFRHHACTFFMEPLLAGHDRGAVEVFAYAELREEEDAATDRYRGYADHWIPTRSLSDAALAERIRADGIDILVDLAGHTKGNRLGMFALKPAPVSLSWMGFGCTTGLSAIDYYLTDEASAPVGSEHLFSETPWRLPDTPYAVYRPGAGMGEVSVLPALSRGYVTVGSLTRGVRINERTVRVWTEILRRIPGARLVIDSRSFEDPAVQHTLAARFVAQGAAPEQLQIGCHNPWEALRGIDIGLDCFPHNSGTTLFESLYMGLPFVSLADRPSVGRIGSAILQGLGRPEWIAHSEAEYVDKVVALASDLPALAQLRQGLRAEMQASPLMDEAGFVQRVEDAYRQMFAQWAGAQPQAAADMAPADMSLEALQAELAYNQANQCHEQGDLAEAEMQYRRALALRPRYAEALSNLGLVLQEQGRMADAIAAYRQAVAIRPDYALAHYNLGHALQHSGDLVGAVACYHQAMALGLVSEHLFDNLLFLLNYHPDLSAEEIYASYQAYERRFGLPHRAAWVPHTNTRNTKRVLKVGYVSPDFRNHAVCRFLEPLLAAHDKTVVQVFAYAELAREDEATLRFKTYVDQWVPTRGLSDDALAARIRADGIDILVDLAGHTKGNRLGVFARKPAPVSLSWMGYGYTTGLSAIDYYLTDEASAPAGSEHLFSEKLWRLPELPYAVYRPSADMGDVGTPPVLQRGFVTLGSLSRSIRINAHTLRVWSNILHRLPDARLVIDSRNFADDAACQALRAKFEALGVAADRLHIGCHSPPWDVLRGIDIGLDCFPHNSGTTLFETLYMGVPFVTLAGRPSVGRIGSAILHGLGRPEWIAETEADYVDKVVELAQNTSQLTLLRMMLRSQMQVSPLMDEAGFARGVEAAYADMFNRWAKAHPQAAAAPSEHTSGMRLADLHAEVAYNQANQLHEQGRLAEAEARYGQALKLRPNYAQALSNRGLVLQAQGRNSEAEAAYRQALAIRPDYALAHHNLGNVLQHSGDLVGAVACYHRAMALGLVSEHLFDNLLFLLNYHPDLSAEEIYASYQAYERRFGLPHRAAWVPHTNTRNTKRVLKVGYVSPDFRNHAVCRFLEPLLAAHDKTVVQVFAYAELAREDEATLRFKSYVDQWVPTRGLSDDALAARIRADGIDILVDLAGHTKGNRLGVFARKPAPVSLSWMGYGYTTGLSAIDYYLTDEASAPAGSEHLFSEKLWRLPELPYAVYRPSADMGDVGTPPVLQRGFITLGSLSRSIRINAHTLRVWSNILHRLPDARLVIDSRNFADDAACQALRAKFEALGVAADRLHIGCHSPPWDVLRGIDIGLDCFPHNSGTTLFETLYMGVPFVTLAGRPSVGRIGSAILHGLGRPEWIAETEADYVDKVVELAQNTSQLALLRMMLRSQMQVSPLMDEAGFARGVEAAYADMFGRWASQKLAEPVGKIKLPKASKAKAVKPDKSQGKAAGPSQQEAEALVQLFRERRFADGERLATQLTTRFPDSGFAWKALGVMLQPQGRPAEVLAAKIRAAELLPGDAEAHCNLGHVLQDQGRLAEAERALQRALALKPDYLEAHNNLGITYQKQGRLDESLASFRRALALDPAQEDIYSNLLFTANYHPDQSAEDIYAAYREYDLRYGQPLRGGWMPHGNPRQAGPVLGRVLKVGYVSPDFRNHACCRFLEPLLAAHHKGVVQTYAYAELAREDEASARYRSYVDHWVPTRGMSDAALAERIRADGIDILVDVAGHTVGNRLGVFARKPAPVSLSWLGFGYTTGLSAIDYYLTDEASTPAGCESLFAETPWRLPAGWAYRPAEGMGEPGPLPALRTGHITLGTLTRSVRINHHTVRVWCEILRRLPDAHLVVDSGSFVDAAAQEALAERFTAHGIAADRLHIGYHSPPWDVLRGIDIGLDCFPHNSGTTLFESLYMGVPYVSLAGRPSVGRLGSSILQGAGHPEWIAETEAEYIDKVVALAQDWPALAAVRQQLRGQMQASVLMDEDGFAHQVEAAYLQMFATWSAGNNDALEALVQQAQAVYNLGNAQHDQGQLDAAEISFRKALALVPEFAEAHANLALVLQQQGRVAEAEPCYRQALLLNPESATAHYNLGTNLKAQGQLKEAEQCFRAALARRPDFTPALLNLDRVLQELGRWVESEVYWRDMLRVKPDNIAAYLNLSAVLRRQQRATEALACLRKASEIEPDNVSLNMHIGSVLKDLNRFPEAEAIFRRAIEREPQSAIAWNGLAEVFNATQRLVQAEHGFRRAVELDPKLAPAYGNLGIVLQNQGRLHEAETSMRQSLALAPADASAHGNLLFVLNYHPDKTGDEVFAEYRAYDENFCVQHRKEWKPHGNQRDAGRVLKVGYVSPDFRSHSCCNFLEPLLSRHDKSQVRVYAYAELLREDAATARYKAYVDHWVPTRGMADAALAERIRADGIDILVDLAGHTGGSRLGVFARKPAPVSLTWMGYGYTTGLSAIDYFLTDAASAPPGSESFFSEKPWRLPTGWVYRPAGAAHMGEVSALPAAQNGYVTFGTLTRAVRVNHRTVRVWAELLKRVPNARLVIDSRSYQDAETQEELAARFMAQGVAREQLLIGCHSPPWDVLRGIDIGLDCFPHNSGTTLFETLYMGIPFVTLADRPSVGCLGSSILHGIGHAEWIAATEEDYIAKAAALAQDTARLATLRANLRAEMQASALMDEAAFTRQVEDAYRQMFNQWCGAKP